MPVSFFDKVWDFGKSIWDETDPNRRPPESDLSRFVAQVKQNGLAKTSKFVVTMGTPICLTKPQRVEALGSDSKQYSEMLAMLCRSAILPGINFDTSPLIIGSSDKIEVPYEKVFDDVTLTFYVDSRMETKAFFDHWFDAIQLQSTKGFEYYKNFVTNIDIDVIDERTNKVYSVRLQEAYPKNMSAIGMDYASNEVMTLSVTFTYKNWISTTLAIPKDKEPKSFLDELFGDNPFYQGAKSAIGSIGKIFTTVEEYTTRFESLKGKALGFEDKIKGIPGIFKSKKSRIKDLGKWL